MLSDTSGAEEASNADTSLLYAGEQYDGSADMYYNRARYYDPSNGRFNRTDPYAGNSQDPQSLHKYLYCHANPINAIDPSGMFWGMSTFLSVTFIIVSVIFLIQYVAIPAYRAFRRRQLTSKAEEILAEVRRYMESNGWFNVGPDMGPDNALAHASANIIAAASPYFDDPAQALQAFLMREVGDALHTQMDRANNIAGNQLAVRYLEIQPENRISYYLQYLELTWIENEELVTGFYPQEERLMFLDGLFAMYYDNQTTW